MNRPSANASPAGDRPSNLGTVSWQIDAEAPVEMRLVSCRLLHSACGRYVYIDYRMEMADHQFHIQVKSRPELAIRLTA
jgi:hypothetical protein